MKPAEKRIRQLEHLHQPSSPGPLYLWEDFRLLYALSINIPKVWPDPDAMPKFIREAYRQFGSVPCPSSQEPFHD